MHPCPNGYPNESWWQPANTSPCCHSPPAWHSTHHSKSQESFGLATRVAHQQTRALPPPIQLSHVSAPPGAPERLLGPTHSSQPGG